MVFRLVLENFIDSLKEKRRNKDKLENYGFTKEEIFNSRNKHFETINN